MNVRVHLRAQRRIEEHEVRLVVEGERPVVEVHRADRAPEAVHDERLRVHHRRLILVDADRRRAAAPRSVRAPPTSVVFTSVSSLTVRMRTSTPRCPRLLEQLPEIVVGDEVRVVDVERLARAGDRERDEPLGRRASRGRRGEEDPGVHAAVDVAERFLGKEHVAGDQLPGAFRPRRRERRLQAHHRRPLEAHVRLAPLVFWRPLPSQ